jgi:flagellar biogenesis protein FliO
MSQRRVTVHLWLVLLLLLLLIRRECWVIRKMRFRLDWLGL